jgi:ABC-type branched-subunit amino acid transport system substrate-binding protein
MDSCARFTGRRALLRAACALVATPALAQPGKAAGRGITVAQIVDTSPTQQDVAKDFLIGSRAAWQDINSKGGLRGRSVNHVSVEVDGTLPSLKAAVARLRDNPACVVLSGTVGDPVAAQLTELLRQDKLAIAHAAPWLQNSSVEVDEQTFPIFASRQEQIGHALRSLTVMGVQALGAVYASNDEYALYHQDLHRIATEFKLQLQVFRADGELSRLGQRLTAATPAILLFVGGTPELVQFTQGLEKQARQRYVIALADVNLQTMLEMGGGRTTPVIATQAVPMVTASLPVVRAYRDTLARLFDEPPAPLSLAGFIAARYTHEVLSDIDGTLTRPGVLAAFQRRSNVDVGGYRVAFDPRKRSGGFVTQSMLTTDGRVVG